ncbi:MAG: TetR/AcrR family transcriptional regulator [Pikeienuella sp.]
MAQTTQTTLAPKRKLSKRGAKTERKFLNAANDVFWAHGFAGSKISQIVTSGGLSVGSFYHQFTDKTELLERATDRLLADFHKTYVKMDLSRSTNGDVFTMLYRLTYTGRLLIARHRGIYRATAELAQNDFSGFGPMQAIGPAVVEAVRDVLPEYADQMPQNRKTADTAYAVQLITMSALQTELGMGPLYPNDLGAFSRVIARAACGVLRYSGQTEAPVVTFDGEQSQ